MKVSVWGINYVPELTGIAPYNAAFCRFLAAQGHEVRMITSFAYYPEWRKRAQDRGQLHRREQDGEVRVHRCWHYVPRRPSSLKRILHEASFVLTSFVTLLVLPRADVYVVVSPPLLLGLFAGILGRVRRVPFVFHVQDLQPDAAAGLGMVKGGTLLRVLYWLEAVAYRRAAKVSGISEGMVRAFERKGVPETKCILTPNGIEFLAAPPPRGRFRRHHGIGDDEFLAVYSGNLGVKQGLEVLVDAAKLLAQDRGGKWGAFGLGAGCACEITGTGKVEVGRSAQESGTASPVRIIICGDGAARASLERRLEVEGIANVTLMSLLPAEEYHALLADTDVAVITQQKGTGSCFFPSKLLATLACARPVLAVADKGSELARAVGEGGFGRVTGPGDPVSLAAALDSMAKDRGSLGDMGEAGRRYVERFEMSKVLGDFGRVIEGLAPSAQSRRREGVVFVQQAGAPVDGSETLGSPVPPAEGIGVAKAGG
jgi:colanic acid biosynthesis glycosyl transferase WcaI